MTQQVRAYTVLADDLNSVPRTHVGISQLPVIPGPGNLLSLVSVSDDPQVHIPIHKIKNDKSNYINMYSILLVVKEI